MTLNGVQSIKYGITVVHLKLIENLKSIILQEIHKYREMCTRKFIHITISVYV